MNKKILGIFLILTVVLMTACTNNNLTGQVVDDKTQIVTSTANKPVVTVGVSVVLSGDMSNLGQSFSNSAKLAIANLPADTKYNYELVIEDDRLDGKVAASVMQKFMAVDNVDAVVSFSSGMGNVIGPIADENGIIHCSVASDPNVAKGDYSFIHWTTPQEENSVMVKELKDRGVKTIGILAYNQQGVQATIADLKPKLSDAGIDFNIETYNAGEKDFKTLLLKLEKKNPDYLLLLMFSPELEIAAKQYVELGMTIPLTSIEAFEYTDQVDLFNGYWYVQGADAKSEFSDSYLDTYGSNHKLGSPNGYDCINLIVNAYEKAGDGKTKPSAEKVVAVFENIKIYPGAVGPLSVDENHIVQSQAVVRQVKDGKFITLSSIETSDKAPIKIGLSAPLTGEGASYGRNELAGATLAVKEVNDAGGINGRKILLVVEDDQCGAKSVNAFNKLINVDKVVGIIGPLCSAAAGPAMPIARDNNMPIVLVGASAPGLVTVGDNIYRAYPSDTFQGIAGAELMYNTLGIKKVAILYVENDWGQGIQKTFKQKYEELGGEIVYISGIVPTEKDYKTTLLKLKNSGAEGIYLPVYPNQAVPVLKQIIELGIDLPIVSGDAFAADEILKSGYADGVMFTVGKIATPEEFKQKINSLDGFEDLESNFIASIGYDGTMVLIKAIETAGTDNDAIIAALAKTHYKAVSQPLIEFGSDRELTKAEFDYKIIKGETYVDYK